MSDLKTDMISIVESMKSIGLDPKLILSLEYRKTEMYLSWMIRKAENSLLKTQEQDGLDVISDKQKEVQLTFDRLCLCYQSIIEMQSIIYRQEKEISLLKERLKLRS